MSTWTWEEGRKRLMQQDDLPPVASMAQERTSTLMMIFRMKIEQRLAELPQGVGLAVSPPQISSQPAGVDDAEPFITWHIMPIDPSYQPQIIAAGWTIYGPHGQALTVHKRPLP